LFHRDFIPHVIHVPVWVENLGAVAPELTHRCADEVHANRCKFLVLAVDVGHLNRESDFLPRQGVCGFHEKNRQASSSFDPDGFIAFALERETQFGAGTPME
jgi:hypothetical protein